MQRRLVEQAGAVGDGSAFEVFRSIIKAGDAGVGDGTCAHRAGFKGYPQLASGQPVVAQRSRRLTQRDDFGMGRGVVASYWAVRAATDDLAILDYDGAHGYFA